MSFLQTSPQLIKVKQNSSFQEPRGEDREAGKKCKEGINVLCNWSDLNAYTQAKKNKKTLSRHNRWQDSLSSGSKVGFDRVSGVSSIDWPGQKWDDGGVCCDTHYPVNPPVSALQNSSQTRTLSPSLRRDNTAILGNNKLTARRWQTGCKSVQIGENAPNQQWIRLTTTTTTTTSNKANKQISQNVRIFLEIIFRQKCKIFLVSFFKCEDFLLFSVFFKKNLKLIIKPPVKTWQERRIILQTKPRIPSLQVKPTSTISKWKKFWADTMTSA